MDFDTKVLPYPLGFGVVGRMVGIVVVELHVDPRDIVPLLLEEDRGDGGVHSAAHPHQDALSHRGAP